MDSEIILQETPASILGTAYWNRLRKQTWERSKHGYRGGIDQPFIEFELLPMKALLVRVGADQSDGGGKWNGPIDSASNEFAYVPIPETGSIRTGMACPYSLVGPAVEVFGLSVPNWLDGMNMHLDPDFEHLTYGDQGQRAMQIKQKLGPGDLLVFYAGLCDVRPQSNLVYALIGLYVIDGIVPAHSIEPAYSFKNAHTRRILSPDATDIVIQARSSTSGRLTRCLPIGSFRPPEHAPQKIRSYRVAPDILRTWGGLSVADGYLQRSARLPEFTNAPQFYAWFQQQNVPLVPRNN